MAGGCVADGEAETDAELGSSQHQLHGSLEAFIRAEATGQGLEGSPTLDGPALTPAEQELLDKRVQIGRFVFHDQALGGPMHSSCSTCHHPAFAGADGQNIARGTFCVPNGDGTVTCTEAPPDGEDGNVVGPHRTAPLNERNSPSVFNTPLFPKQMADGRFHWVDQSSLDVNELDPTLGFNVQGPEGILFTRSLLAAQAFKPVPSIIEMSGPFPYEEGEVLPESDVRAPAVQAAIAARINSYPEYREMFEAAYPAGGQIWPTDPVIGEDDDITYFAIADAMAHWEEQTLVMTDAPWDAFLAGDDDAISQSAKRGAAIFFTRGKCSTCHSGDLFTDFRNYNIGVPQVGPGTGSSDDDPLYAAFDTWDFGHEVTTGNRGDRFEFRTPPLRGVTLTSPYMHNGAYTDLGDAIRHHAYPVLMNIFYDDSQLWPDVQAVGVKPFLPVLFDRRNPLDLGPGADTRIWFLSNQDVDDLIAFLRTLTDPRMLDFANAAPAELPSGVPADVPGPREFPLFQ